MKLILAIGSNLGDKKENLKKAISLINNKIGSVVKTSSFYCTEPVGFISDNEFVNAVIEVKTKMPVYRVLKTTQKIEKLMGRTQKSEKEQHFDRIIDIDILLYSNIKINTSCLNIPHPKMYEREFVMKPFLEITHKNKRHC